MARYICHMTIENWWVGYNWMPGSPVWMQGEAAYGIEDTETGQAVPPVPPGPDDPGYMIGRVSLYGGVFPASEIRPSFEKAALAKEPVLHSNVTFSWTP